MAADFTVEDLTAYLDGEANPDLALRIETALKQDAALQTRLDLLSIDKADLRNEFDALLTEAPSNLVPQAPVTNNNWGFAGAVAASLFVGLGIGFLVFSKPAPPAPGWTQYVAAYQALYVTQTIDEIADSPTDLSGLSGVLGRELAPAMKAPDLQFKRGQLLGFKGKPLIQMAYLSDTGAPIALCIIKKPGEASEIKTSVLEGMNAASWSDGSFAYLLIGGTDADLIQRSAAHFKALL